MVEGSGTVYINSTMRRTLTGSRTFKGRGTLSNPPGRFDLTQLAPVDDGWYVEESPDTIATTLEPDRAREVITTNDSPDVGFEQSINPYRGCSHGCTYCASPATPVLMADGSLCEIGRLQVGDLIYGTERRGRYRRYVRTPVLARWDVIKPAYRVTLADGTQLTIGADHRFLTDRGWKYITGKERGAQRRPHLTVANKLMGTGAFASPVHHDAEYRRGYLTGLIRGDGTIASTPFSDLAHNVRWVSWFRLALCDEEALQRAHRWLSYHDVELQQRACASSASRPMRRIACTAREKVRRISELIAWPDHPSRPWQAGLLAGMFDAEGSYSGGIMRISNTDDVIVAQLDAALRAFNFPFVVTRVHPPAARSIDVIRVTGGLREHLRFFHTLDPAITRKRDIAGQAIKSQARLGVVSIEPLGKAMRLIDITTGTGDYISDGVVSHNCYARPSHAYMGLSPGLDFETRLFYKADAARVLEEQLARPAYVCKPIMLGANTDPYQPDERRLKVTRSILEVLARTRHPVNVLTKSALVLRDADLLAELARHNLAGVALSVTTLDNELKRTMEPRTASPQARLRAIAELRAAGIPCGVMAAPMIPALNDHELEQILTAAAEAGAQWAGYVLLRLPYEIKDLFREWLAEHYPQRAEHVMSLIREMRGGRDNDPRFGTRMRGTGPYAQLLRERFRIACRRLGLDSGRHAPLDTSLFSAPTPPGAQLRLGL
jgi:DNA repair photolyase